LYQGSIFTLDAKYTGGRHLLKGQSNEKYGLATRQLVESLDKIFNKDISRRLTFSDRGSNGKPLNQFGLDRIRKIKRIYPILVVQDFSRIFTQVGCDAQSGGHLMDSTNHNQPENERSSSVQSQGLSLELRSDRPEAGPSGRTDLHLDVINSSAHPI
jgi:hypothetical protein